MGVPVSVLMGESLDLAFFVAERWEPVSGKDSRPGLKVAVAGGLIEETVSQDIRELVMAVSHAHAQYRAVTASTLEAPVERGEFLLTEIRQCLEFLFDDGVSDEQDCRARSGWTGDSLRREQPRRARHVARGFRVLREQVPRSL